MSVLEYVFPSSLSLTFSFQSNQQNKPGGYDTFFAVRSQVQIIGVEVPELEDSFHDIALISALEKHYKEAKCPIKAVVLSHPHNPLGRPYPPHVLKQCMAFCRDHNLHLISDEVFALSTFTSPDLQNWAAFKSVLSIDPSTVGLDPSRVHVLWSMSKDLAASGIRLVRSLLQFDIAQGLCFC